MSNRTAESVATEYIIADSLHFDGDEVAPSNDRLVDMRLDDLGDDDTMLGFLADFLDPAFDRRGRIAQ